MMDVVWLHYILLFLAKWVISPLFGSERRVHLCLAKHRDAISVHWLKYSLVPLA